MHDSPSSPNRRVAWIDWLRIVAILVVFLFHSMHFFDTMGWHVKNEEQSLWLTAVLLFLAAFVMPLFFALSGGAARLAGAAAPTRDFVKGKLLRLGVPYLTAVVVLIPPQKYLEALQRGYFEGSFLAFLGHYPVYLVEQLGDWRVLLSFSPRLLGHFGYHAWFLAFLFLMLVATAPLFAKLGQPVWKDRIARLGRWVEVRPMASLLFALPVAAVNLSLRAAFPEYLDWADVAYFLLFLLGGFLLLSDPALQRAVKGAALPLLGVGVALSSLLLAYIFLSESGSQVVQEPAYRFPYLAVQLAASLNTTAWVLGLLGASMRWLDRPHAALPRLTEAVLPFYLLHQTVILLVGYPVVALAWPIAVKLGVIVLLSAAIVVALYGLVIRHSRWLRALFGMSPAPKARRRAMLQQGVEWSA